MKTRLILPLLILPLLLFSFLLMVFCNKKQKNPALGGITPPTTIPPKPLPDLEDQPCREKYQPSFSPKVWGGQEVKIEDFPFIVRISMRNKNNDKMLCTGSVLSDRHILTAGHCIKIWDKDDFEYFTDFTVYGKTQNGLYDGTEGESYKVKSASAFNDEPTWFIPNKDLGILTLENSLVFDEKLSPLLPVINPNCLFKNDKDEVDFDTPALYPATAIGWSKYDAPEKPTEKGTLNTFTYPADSIFRSYVIYNTDLGTEVIEIKAKKDSEDNMFGIVNGDSGGPLLINYLDGFRGIGIVSTINKYTSAHNFNYLVPRIDWIKQKTGLDMPTINGNKVLEQEEKYRLITQNTALEQHKTITAYLLFEDQSQIDLPVDMATKEASIDTNLLQTIQNTGQKEGLLVFKIGYGGTYFNIVDKIIKIKQ